MSADAPDRAGADDDPLIRDERAHLVHARACLHAMRRRAEDLQAAGGDPVSTEYLKAAVHHRARSLVDDPSVPLFFGRVDYIDPSERFHVGRRHVHDDAGDPVVIDWRAEAARPFYRATPGEPMGLGLRRRFGFSAGELTAYEDETFTGEDGEGTSTILTEEIERPRSGPMRDIVATIQPEQDEIVRAGLDETICVQGAPGTGKTAVGLHRAAFLLYAYRERLRRAGVLVVGPNRSFLAYIRQVLPALGEFDVTQVTLDELVAHIPVHGTDPPEVATIKGDARMARVLERAVWSAVREPAEGLVVPRGARRWRVPAYELGAIVEQLRQRELRYGAGRALLPKRIAARIVARMEESGEAPSERTLSSIASSAPVKKAVDSVWPALDPVRLVFGLLADPDALATAADGLLDRKEQQAIGWTRPPRSPRSARWSAADAVLVDEATDLLERTSGFGHVILDEAQDLSAMQCRVVGRRCETASATVLGDLAQGTTPWATERWRDSLDHLGKGDARVETLRQGYRVPREIIDHAGRLLPQMAPAVQHPVSLRQAPGSLLLRRPEPEGLVAETVERASSAARSEGSVGVITADVRAEAVLKGLAEAGVPAQLLNEDGSDRDGQLTVVPATLAKGLEFDHVIVVEPAEIVAAEVRGLRRLYVVLTRAVSRLTVVAAEALPPALRD